MDFTVPISVMRFIERATSVGHGSVFLVEGFPLSNMPTLLSVMNQYPPVASSIIGFVSRRHSGLMDLHSAVATSRATRLLQSEADVQAAFHFEATLRSLVAPVTCAQDVNDVATFFQLMSTPRGVNFRQVSLVLLCPHSGPGLRGVEAAVHARYPSRVYYRVNCDQSTVTIRCLKIPTHTPTVTHPFLALRNCDCPPNRSAISRSSPTDCKRVAPFQPTTSYCGAMSNMVPVSLLRFVESATSVGEGSVYLVDGFPVDHMPNLLSVMNTRPQAVSSAIGFVPPRHSGLMDLHSAVATSRTTRLLQSEAFVQAAFLLEPALRTMVAVVTSAQDVNEAATFYARASSHRPANFRQITLVLLCPYREPGLRGVEAAVLARYHTRRN